MPDYRGILRRSLRVCGVLVVLDFVVALLVGIIGFSAADAFGDLLLLEVAAFFIGAGLLDLSSSVGMSQFRRAVTSSKEEFSPSKRSESEQHILVLFFVGSILFAATVLLTVYDLFLR
jgi:hypothetical protein